MKASLKKTLVQQQAQAVTKYREHLSEIAKAADELQTVLGALHEVDDEDINWGHVGCGRILADRLSKVMAYAKEMGLR